MRTLLLLLLTVALHAHAADAPPSTSGIGINLDAPIYWQSDWPFIDEFKRASGWSTRCEASMPQCRDFAPGRSGANTGEQAQLELDANGWVKRLPAADDPRVKFRHVSALLFQGNGGSHAAGRYVVLYEGDGTLVYAGAGKKVAAESRPGRDVLDVTNKPGEGLSIRITRINEQEPLRNIRVIGPGGVCANAPEKYVPDASSCDSASAFRSLEQLYASQIFHPAYLADLRGFRALRFMKWSATEATGMVRWDQRPRPGDATWAGPSGVPYEAMFALAAATGADPWINVAPSIDDDFARELARLARRSLKAGSTLWFEYGNEPWNAAPPYSRAGTLYEQMARSKWPDATLEPWQLRLNAYALRAAQLCRIVKQEFGADARRVRCVANSQAANPQVSQVLLACELAKAELGRPCAREFDALAIAPYFGHYLGSNTYAASVDRWADDPASGLTALFSEITGRDTPPLYTPGGRTPREGALEQAAGWIAASKKVADRHGVPMVAYEGGQHLTVPRGGKAEALFRAANHDPRMGAAMQRLIEAWKAAGGQLFVVFSYTQQPGRGGFWGMKEAQRDEEAPKWQAIMKMRDEPCWWSGCR
ncbi:hypothetical protein [Piscinibacter sp. XHJ-5]|uniref:hypothetical protein n=1 Tax=Piscinibacter sp. XHJ-5 TaxID=3037797 RepID=UPI002452816F|nr:hypothetical protein [Piscinibacter sp. XHJ-5]